MSYLLDKSRKRKRNLIILTAVIFLGAVFYFRTGVWNGLSFAALKVFHPVLVSGNNIGEKWSNMGAYFFSKAALVEENSELRAKLAEDEARMLNYDLVISENDILKEIMSRKKESVNMLLAPILSKPNQSAYDTLLVDAGTEDGVKVGALVYALGDIPIGRVGSATEDASKIILFSSAEERTQSVIKGNVPAEEGKSRDIFYELVGRGGGNFEMTLPRDIALMPGDQAVMPGLLPLVLAVTEKIISDPRDPFTKALLVSPVNMQNIKFVGIAVSK